jgi:uncharacterized protein
MHSLPVLTCNDCGACCLTMGTPPGFILAFARQADSGFLKDDEGDEDHPEFAELLRLWESMPSEVRQELADYYGALWAGRVVDRAGEEQPCLWLDLQTRQCRHYEHRPPVCRDFAVGGQGCFSWRKKFGLPWPEGLEPSADLESFLRRAEK